MPQGFCNIRSACGGDRFRHEPYPVQGVELLHVTGRMGPGFVSVTLILSEPLATTPFLSINPIGAVPMTVNLAQQSDLIYTGLFSIDQDTPTGTAYAVFSARDEAGNRGMP